MTSPSGCGGTRVSFRTGVSSGHSCQVLMRGRGGMMEESLSYLPGQRGVGEGWRGSSLLT